jgi:hypothetical protein
MRLNTRHVNPKLNPLSAFGRLVDAVMELPPVAALSDKAIWQPRLERMARAPELPEQVYGRPRAVEALGQMADSVRAELGLEVIAVGLWGQSRSSEERVHTDYKIGVLCQGPDGAREMLVAREALPKNFGTGGPEGLYFAAWALKNEIAWIRRDGQWAWTCSLRGAGNSIVAEHPTQALGIHGEHGVLRGEDALARDICNGLSDWAVRRKMDQDKRDAAAQLKQEAAAERAARAGKQTPEERVRSLLPEDKFEIGMAIEEAGELNAVAKTRPANRGETASAPSRRAARI